MREERQRVVVTGMGVVTVLGQSTRDLLASLLAGRSGITRWKKPMDARLYCKIGGDMSQFDLEAHLGRADLGYPPNLVSAARKLLRPTPMSGRLTLPAALQAFVEAGLTDSRIPPERFGHIMAGHNLNSNYTFEGHVTFLDEPDYIDGLFGMLSIDTDVLSVVSQLLGLKGPSFTVGGACASGNLGVMAGLDLLRAGRADAVLVTGGGVEVDPPALHAWTLIDAVSYRSFNDDPERASRPFDARREGFVPSEGSGAVVLETLAGARARGAHIHAEILGASSAADASRLTKPDREGQARAMRGALADAGVDAEGIGYVNAHATSTPLGDAVEVAALKEVFGSHAYRIPVNATKSMLGHCLSAAGVVELVATILQMKAGAVHPTINQETQDPELDLDFVPNESRVWRFDLGMSNAFGFGGLNSCVVVGRAP